MSDDKKNWWMEIDRQSDIDTLESLKETKELLVECDQSEVPEDDDFFDRLHDKIMAGVEKTEVQKDSRPLWVKQKKVFRAVASVAMIISVLLVGLDTQQVPMTSDGTDQVLSDAVSRSPDIEQTILVYQNKDDFFVDLAQESLDHLSVDHLQGLVRSDD